MGRHWHKRIVRAGANTLSPTTRTRRTASSPTTTSCSATSARSSRSGRPTSVEPSSSATIPSSTRCAMRCRSCGDAGRAFFDAHPDVTGEQLYAHVVAAAEDAGWEFGGTSPGTWSGSSRTRTSPATRSSRTSPRARTSRCAGRTRRAVLPLDPRGPPGRPGAPDRRLLRGTARPGPRSGWPARLGLGPVHGGRAEVLQAVGGPEPAVAGEAVTVGGPAVGRPAGGGALHALWATPGSRGSSRKHRSSKPVMVSAQIAASTPATWAPRPGPSASAGFPPERRMRPVLGA